MSKDDISNIAYFTVNTIFGINASLRLCVSFMPINIQYACVYNKRKKKTVCSMQCPISSFLLWLGLQGFNEVFQIKDSSKKAVNKLVLDTINNTTCPCFYSPKNEVLFNWNNRIGSRVDS